MKRKRVILVIFPNEKKMKLVIFIFLERPYGLPFSPFHCGLVTSVFSAYQPHTPLLFLALCPNCILHTINIVFSAAYIAIGGGRRVCHSMTWRHSPTITYLSWLCLHQRGITVFASVQDHYPIFWFFLSDYLDFFDVHSKITL